MKIITSNGYKQAVGTGYNTSVNTMGPALTTNVFNHLENNYSDRPYPKKKNKKKKVTFNSQVKNRADRR